MPNPTYTIPSLDPSETIRLSISSLPAVGEGISGTLQTRRRRVEGTEGKTESKSSTSPFDGREVRVLKTGAFSGTLHVRLKDTKEIVLIHRLSLLTQADEVLEQAFINRQRKRLEKERSQDEQKLNLNQMGSHKRKVRASTTNLVDAQYVKNFLEAKFGKAQQTQKTDASPALNHL